jgi:hypothetical protein
MSARCISSWRKSSHSGFNGQCIEVGGWRKSSHSMSNGNCVEVGGSDVVIGIRDTMEVTHPYPVILSIPAYVWNEFSARVKYGWTPVIQ